MSSAQWAEMMLGDESYAGASSYYKLKDAVQEILGFEYFLPTHQGRAAENVLFSTLLGVGSEGAGKIVRATRTSTRRRATSNSGRRRAIDCTTAEARHPETDYPFKGNVDLDMLEKCSRSIRGAKSRCACSPSPAIPRGASRSRWRTSARCPRYAEREECLSSSTRPASPRIPISSRSARPAMRTRASVKSRSRCSRTLTAARCRARRTAW